jgi:hypothetical protein
VTGWVTAPKQSSVVESGLAVDDGHVPFVVAFAGGRSELVQPLDLLGTQLEAVRCCVLLDAGDPLRAGNRGDVIALREFLRLVRLLDAPQDISVLAPLILRELHYRLLESEQFGRFGADGDR